MPRRKKTPPTEEKPKKEPSPPRRPRIYHDPLMAKPKPLESIQQLFPCLMALNQHRWLTNSQVSDLLFRGQISITGEERSIAAAQRAANAMCLIRLKDRELLTRLTLFRSGPSFPFAYPVNTLTATGAQLLANHFADAGRTTAIRPLTKKLPFHTMDHEIAVRDVAIQLERASVDQGWDFIYYQGDEDFEAHKKQDYSGEMIPDGFFLIRHEGRLLPHFLEVDMGSETVVSGGSGGSITTKDWQTKFTRYLDYLPRHQRDGFLSGAESNPVVLTVTTSNRRMESLRKAAVDAGCRGMFWFTTFENLRADWPMSALNFIWSTPHEKTTRALVNRIQS